MNVSTNISSIQAHQNMMNTSANNVANVNTDRFVPTNTRVVGSENSLRADNVKADDTGSKISQTDLAKEITTQIIAQDTTALNVNAIRTQDEMLGSLLDIKA